MDLYAKTTTIDNEIDVKINNVTNNGLSYLLNK
jgi:hypothetical protein